jgi:hypothetical protein
MMGGGQEEKRLAVEQILKYVFLMKECPKCELVSPDTAERCDCGYDFALESMRSTDSAAKRGIRTVLKGVAGVAGVIWLLAPITRYPGPVVFVASTVVLLHALLAWLFWSMRRTWVGGLKNATRDRLLEARALAFAR